MCSCVQVSSLNSSMGRGHPHPRQGRQRRHADVSLECGSCVSGAGVECRVAAGATAIGGAFRLQGKQTPLRVGACLLVNLSLVGAGACLLWSPPRSRRFLPAAFALPDRHTFCGDSDATCVREHLPRLPLFSDFSALTMLCVVLLSLPRTASSVSVFGVGAHTHTHARPYGRRHILEIGVTARVLLACRCSLAVSLCTEAVNSFALVRTRTHTHTHEYELRHFGVVRMRPLCPSRRLVRDGAPLAAHADGNEHPRLLYCLSATCDDGTDISGAALGRSRGRDHGHVGGGNSLDRTECLASWNAARVPASAATWVATRLAFSA
ncbi:Alg9-like mannosyltransferase, putative [Leishmania donovani]|uniref:Alg9-like mannosyltransferase, putative n=1 Tax=Leishmania donovani TaxID=5661 RepID=E9BAY9_LEIDO|nr:Alg9-like mannosyltransferase, putative [Leishmania donovani]CBZ32414.1 Alg9-like mannosyltransferase, putative [Leishmania donovani]